MEESKEPDLDRHGLFSRIPESFEISSSSDGSSLKSIKISVPRDRSEKNPTFVRFVRSDTHVNTNISDFEYNRLKSIPDLEALKPIKSTKNIESDPDHDKKELLKDFIKVREATDYEILEERNYRKANPYIKPFIRIKIAFSELCFIICKNSIFETFIILVILANTFTIAVDSLYTIPSNLDLLFLVIYTIECGIKISAFGLYIPSESYLKDKWNLVDFIIVITGWIESFQYKLNSLRMLRILRPLRNISSIKGLRVIFMALIQAAKPLVGTLGTLIFFIFIFSITGIETMMGAFRFRCLEIDTGVLAEDSHVCGNTGCLLGWECTESLINPNFDNTSFDDILSSLIIVFECVTLQTWVPLMNLAEKTLSYATVLFFIPLSFVGAFLILNLTLAVIKSAFTKSMEKVRMPKFDPELEEEVLRSLESEPEGLENNENLKNLENTELYYEKKEVLLEKKEVLLEKQETPYLIKTGIGRSIRSPRMVKNQDIDNLDNAKDFKYYLGKLKHSISMRKDLITKIKKNHKINRIKLHLPEKYKYIHESIEDVRPKTQGFEALMPGISEIYNFTYKGVSCDFESELEKKWRLDSEEFFNKHSDLQTNMNIFTTLSLKSGPESAFNQMMGLTKEKIKCIEFEDLIKGVVEGSWSGYDVSQEDDRNANYCESLSDQKYAIWKSGLRGKMQRVQCVAKVIENSKATIFVMTIVVILNALILSLEYYGMSVQMQNTLDTINLVFNLIFIGELFIRIAALGITEFSRDSMNYIDAIVIILSFLELSAKIGSSALSAFRAIRVFRILRIYRFTRGLIFMKSLICVITYSIPKFIYLALLLALLNLVYALLGYQIFANKLNFSTDNIRANFDNFTWAYLAVFQVLTLSGYSEVLYAVMRSSVGRWSALYIFIWIIIGNFVVLNLFIAILLDSFTQENEESEDMNLLEKTVSLSKASLFTSNRSKTLRKKEVEKMKILQNINSSAPDHVPVENPESPMLYNKGSNKSYCIFSKLNPFRIICYKISESKKFNFGIFIVIYLNCITLVWETYTINYSNDSGSTKAIKVIESIFTIIYLIEFLLKTISIGVIGGQKSYFKEPWNVFDFLILIISVLDTFTTYFNMTSLKVFRVIKALRPLKFISKNSSMKHLVSALLSSIGAITNVVLVLFIVWFMFAVLGVSIFSGKLYECENTYYDLETDCKSAGYAWVNSETNFDNIFEAFLSLFIVGLLENWQEIMYLCIDARGQGISGSQNYNAASAYYFVFFIFIGSFFFLHLFMGVVFIKFHQVKQEEYSINTLLLTPKQQFWIEMQRLIVEVSPQIILKKPESNFKSFVYSIVTSQRFELFIFGVILVNMITMSMSYQNASSSYMYSLEIVNIVCVCIFTIEAFAKIYGVGFTPYFKINWNIFDLLVVMCAYIDIILDSQLSLANRFLRTGPQIFRVFRIFRVTRLIRVFKPLKSLRNLLTIVNHSLPALLNVLSLLLLCIFIYSIIGVFLFSGVKSGHKIDDFNNFSNFLSACILLLRISTGGDWPQIMFDCAHGVGKLQATVFFCSYISITILVILNLFIMVIIQNFEDFESNPNSYLYLFTKQLGRFNRSWEKYSSFSYGIKIRHKDLVGFMKSLGHGIGFESTLSFADSVRILSKMSFVIDSEGNVAYHDLLYAVLNRIYGTKMELETDKVALVLLRKQERETIAKLEKLKTKAEWLIFKKKSNNQVAYEKSLKRQSTCNLFAELIYIRKIFRGWKNVTVKSRLGQLDLNKN